MSEEAQKVKAKGLGGWGLDTLDYIVRKPVQGLPYVGSRVSIWQWGPTIWRLDRCPRSVIEAKEVAALEADGSLERVYRKGQRRPRGAKVYAVKEAA